jgi:precorrin-2 dehydrogenase/sirohydrochlorin ferrochelatase
MESVPENIDKRVMIFNIRIKGKKILIVGGGEIAERKIKKFESENPDICVIAPKFTPYINDMACEGRLILIRREVNNTDITDDYFLVICATDNKEVNSKIAGICSNMNILHDDLSNQQNSDIIMAACKKIGSLVMAISTLGNSPSLAKKLINNLEGDLTSDTYNFEKDIKNIYDKKINDHENSRKQNDF